MLTPAIAGYDTKQKFLLAQMTLAFTVEEVKHNVPLEEAVFRRP